MSDASRMLAGIILITVPTIAFGGASLLYFLRTRAPGYADNPTRAALFRAGHAHAGVLVILALVGLLYVDQAGLSEASKWLVRVGLAAAPILIPAGFFFSILSPKATRPGGLINLVYVGALGLAAATVTLGMGLLR